MVFANGNTHIGNEQKGLKAYNNGSVFTGTEANPLIMSSYDGRIEICNPISSKLKFDHGDGTVRLISKTSPQNQFLFEPNGTIKIGNTTNPAIQIDPNYNVIRIGNKLRFDQYNGDVRLTCETPLQTQLIFTSAGSIKIGGTGYPLMEIDANNDVGIVRIGNMTEPLLDNETYFDLNVPKAVIRYTNVQHSLYPISVGFQFIPSIDFAYSTNPAYWGAMNDVMALTGLSDGRASIGTQDNNINVVYSKFYFSTGNYIGTLASSDLSLKTNIQKLSTISEKVLKLNPVTYDFVKSSSGEDVSQNLAYKNRAGFIAQEVLDVFPDLVVMGGDSLLRLDYAGLIPYLTKAFQEQSQIIQMQSTEITELRKQMQDIQKGIYTADFIITEETTQPAKAPKQNETGNVLFQNAPNPFNISTTIKYQLSDNAANAKICIYNLTGKQLQCYNLQATKGENSIEVRASSLQSGMYLYSLIVGDKLIDTKRMVLTE
jgi:hypothetical protein